MDWIKNIQNLFRKPKEKAVLVSAGVSKAEYSQFARFLPMTAVGLHYIAAVLRNAGYAVEIINQTNDGLSNDEVKKRINKAKPKFLFFNQFFSTRERIKDLISDVTDEPIIIIGGHDPTFHSQTADLDKEYRGVDYIWQGEAESGLVSQLKSAKKQNALIIINNLSNRVANLDDLPILEHNDYSGDVGFLSTSRGCYKKGCDICTTPPFYPEGWKARGIEHVAKEIKKLKKAGKKFVFICDDNFLGFTKEHLQRGADIIKKCKEEGLKVMIMTIKEQILNAEKEGYLKQWQGTVYRCFLGIESCGECIFKIGKITNAQQHSLNSKMAIEALYNNGIGLFAGWINFEPDSTFDDLKQNADFLLKNGAECANFTNLCQSLRLYEGTGAYAKHRHRNPKIITGEFDYNFDIPEVGEFYRFLMFKMRGKITDCLDNLIYETTDLVYINQIQNTEQGKDYWNLRDAINKHNYDFFMNCMDVFNNKRDAGAIDKENFLKTSAGFIEKFERLKENIAKNAEFK